VNPFLAVDTGSYAEGTAWKRTGEFVVLDGVVLVTAGTLPQSGERRSDVTSRTAE
jgi:hypothetical protein